MKRQYRLSEEELRGIIEASRSTPVMYLSGGVPMYDSPQQNANRAWKVVAQNHGFIWDSAESAGTGDNHDVLAEPIPPVEPVVLAIDEAQKKKAGGK